jgi:hypothetical protein
VTEAVQIAAISAGGTVLVALVGVLVELVRRQGQAIAAVREDTAEARTQVSNTHPTNLRDDVDRILTGQAQLLEGQDRHTEEIGTLRAELLHERRERLAVADRLDEHLTAND